MATITYPSDLTDAEWRVVPPLLPLAKSGGRPRFVDLRRILKGLFLHIGASRHLDTTRAEQNALGGSCDNVERWDCVSACDRRHRIRASGMIGMR